MAKKYSPYLKLKGLRVEKNIPAERLADLLGMSIATYRRKENRKDGADFLVEEAKKAAVILGVDARDIFLV